MLASLDDSVDDPELLFVAGSGFCCQRNECHAGGGGGAPANLAVLSPSWCFNLIDYTDSNGHEISPSTESHIRSNAGGVVLG